MGGVHYLVRSVTFTGAVTGTFDCGAKTGLSGAITCDGNFVDPQLGAYHVHSTDVPVP